MFLAMVSGMLILEALINLLEQPPRPQDPPVRAVPSSCASSNHKMGCSWFSYVLLPKTPKPLVFNNTSTNSSMGKNSKKIKPRGPKNIVRKFERQIAQEQDEEVANTNIFAKVRFKQVT